MPRRRKDDDEFDDEDYQPRRSNGERERTGTPFVLIGGLVLGALVVFGLIAILFVRNRQVAREVQDAAHEQQAASHAKAKPETPPVTPRSTPEAAWARFVGTWRLTDGRTPAAASPRYTFHADRAVTWTLPAAAFAPAQPAEHVTRFRVTDVRVLGDEIRLPVVVQFKGQEGNPDEFVCRFEGNTLRIVPASQLRLVPGHPGDPYVRE